MTKPSKHACRLRAIRDDTLRYEALIYVWRWRYTSNRLLAVFIRLRFGMRRRRIAYDLWRSGLLTRHKRPGGRQSPRERHIYSLSPEGWNVIRDLERGTMLGDLPPPRRVHLSDHKWSLVQHNLDLQALSLTLDPWVATRNLLFVPFLTEPEAHMDFVSEPGGIVPDMLFGEDRYGLWVERDRTRKNALRLALMVQRYADLWRHRPSHAPRYLLIVVDTPYQRARYMKAFDDPQAPQVHYNKAKGKYFWMDDFTHDARTACAGKVKVITFEDALQGWGCLPEAWLKEVLSSGDY